MALKNHIYLLLLLSTISSCLKLSSSVLDAETDYNKWVSWNIDHHRRKAILEAKPTTQPSAGISTGGKASLDDKLRKAEMHNVSITVNQNGTGDFKTITEALKSIPPYNTRRVIIAIKPGVYRYVVCYHFQGITSSTSIFNEFC